MKLPNHPKLELIFWQEKLPLITIHILETYMMCWRIKRNFRSQQKTTTNFFRFLWSQVEATWNSIFEKLECCYIVVDGVFAIMPQSATFYVTQFISTLLFATSNTLIFKLHVRFLFTMYVVWNNFPRVALRIRLLYQIQYFKEFIFNWCKDILVISFSVLSTCLYISIPYLYNIWISIYVLELRLSNTF